MPKNNRLYQAQTQKDIERDRFIRSVSPLVAKRLRAILEEQKRKGEGHE